MTLVPDGKLVPNGSLDHRKIAIVGSREGIPEQAVRQFVRVLTPENHVVISGGAAGPDTWAVDEAKRMGIRTVVIRPNWAKYGKRAGFLRNKEIVAAADDVVAFWNGESKGTEHTINIAVSEGKHVAIFGSSGALIRSILPNRMGV